MEETLTNQKSSKRVAAEARNALWAAIPLERQLQILNERFPNGAHRQKVRIAKKLAAGKK